MPRFVLLVPLLVVALTSPGIVATEATSIPTEYVTFFENRIRPLLAERCWECHSEDVQESQLRLDSLQAMLDGGERGKAIVPGDAKASLLIHAVNHSVELQMPEGDKLAANEIKDLIRWIDLGAPWPGSPQPVRRAKSTAVGPLFTAEDKQFWAFQPPHTPVLPVVENEKWIIQRPRSAMKFRSTDISMSTSRRAISRISKPTSRA